VLGGATIRNQLWSMRCEGASRRGRGECWTREEGVGKVNFRDAQLIVYASCSPFPRWIQSPYLDLEAQYIWMVVVAVANTASSRYERLIIKAKVRKTNGWFSTRRFDRDRLFCGASVRALGRDIARKGDFIPCIWQL
jgi:hypothetical protein